MWRWELQDECRQWRAGPGYSTHSVQITGTGQSKTEDACEHQANEFVCFVFFWKVGGEPWKVCTILERLLCSAMWNGRLWEEPHRPLALTSSHLEILRNILCLLTSCSPTLTTNYKETWSGGPTFFFMYIFLKNISVLVLLTKNKWLWLSQTGS